MGLVPWYQPGACRLELVTRVLCDQLFHLQHKSNSPSPKTSEGCDAGGEIHKDTLRVNFVGCEMRLLQTENNRRTRF